MQKIKIGISTCLLGEKVRYDGGHKLDKYITDTLGHYFEWVAVCPEVEYGLRCAKRINAPNRRSCVTSYCYDKNRY